MDVSHRPTKREIISKLEELVEKAEQEERGMNMVLLQQPADYNRGTLTVNLPYGIVEQIVAFLKKNNKNI